MLFSVKYMVARTIKDNLCAVAENSVMDVGISRGSNVHSLGFCEQEKCATCDSVIICAYSTIEAWLTGSHEFFFFFFLSLQYLFFGICWHNISCYNQFRGSRGSHKQFSNRDI